LDPAGLKTQVLFWIEETKNDNPIAVFVFFCSRDDALKLPSIEIIRRDATKLI
jgi:hypothetical protein